MECGGISITVLFTTDLINTYYLNFTCMSVLLEKSEHHLSQGTKNLVSPAMWTTTRYAGNGIEWT